MSRLAAPVSTNAVVAAAPTNVGPDTFPRWVLWCAGGVLAFALISVGIVRLTGNGPDQLAAAAAATLAQSKQVRALRFEDRPDGSIAVLDGLSGAALVSVQGEQGFLRGTLRALTRERRARGLGAEVPFQLIGHMNGGLTLLDPVTSQRVVLDSFGPAQVAVFTPLLTAAAQDSAARKP
jgi:putative photosynthetic complex assembly protein